MLKKTKKTTMSRVEIAGWSFVYILIRFRLAPLRSWNCVYIFPRNAVTADTIIYYMEDKYSRYCIVRLLYSQCCYRCLSRASQRVADSSHHAHPFSIFYFATSLQSSGKTVFAEVVCVFEEVSHNPGFFLNLLTTDYLELLILSPLSLAEVTGMCLHARQSWQHGQKGEYNPPLTEQGEDKWRNEENLQRADYLKPMTLLFSFEGYRLLQ